MTYLSAESFIIERLQEGGWRVIHRQADLTDLPIADFASHREAEEWVKWKSGRPKINPYAMAAEAHTQPKLIEIAIEPKSKADQDKLGVVLAKFAAEDPGFEASIDHESGQIILRGMSESQLGAKLDTLKPTYGIDARAGAPQVAFRECITQRAEVEYTYKRQPPVSGRFAAVKLGIEPNEAGEGNQFESKVADGAVPEKYISGARQGIESVLTSGVVAGFPVVDVRVTLLGGKYHYVDSSVMAFEVAARMAFREALQKAHPVLLEPVMSVEIVAPEDCVASVIGDLNLRRGRILDQDVHGYGAVVHALVPLANMFGYSNDLSSMSQGRGAFAMRFDHYAPAPLLRPEDDPPFRPAMGMRA
jgi:translation elongation factor EF-G